MGTAMIGAGKGDSAATPGRRAGDFDRVFHRFRTGGHQQGFLGEIAGHFLVHHFAKLQVGLVGQYLEAGVGQLLQLAFHRGDHLRVQVAGVQHRDTAGEIEIFTAFNVPYPAVLRTVGKDRVNLSDAARHRVATALH